MYVRHDLHYLKCETNTPESTNCAPGRRLKHRNEYTFYLINIEIVK